jgi:sugar phosphate isomerase/epimerase
MTPIMKYSIATVSVSGTLDKKLQAIAAAGFDAVEIFESDFISFLRQMGNDLLRPLQRSTMRHRLRAGP